jgi:membrane protease YdiL (CAAX protease family)
MTATASHIQPAVDGPGTPGRSWIWRHPLLAFFAAAYGASLVALAVIGLPTLHPGGGKPLAPLVMFPLMVITVGVAGVALTAAVSGRAAARQLLRGTRRWRGGPAYYLALLIPPACILASLALLHALAGRAFTPNMFPIGLAFGVLAGFFEEFGWSGFAYPRVGARFGLLRGAVLLGLIWGLWHVPVVDSLGAASPHGSALPLFFLAFVLVLTSLRVLIAWIYTRTGSLLMAQCMHASSTGFLVVLGAAHVTSTQEALWYGVYGALLGAAAASVWLLLRPAGQDPPWRCTACTPSTQTLTEADTQTAHQQPPTRKKGAVQ